MFYANYMFIISFLEIVGWHNRLYGYQFEQVPGVGDGQGCLACCSPWGHKESDTTERLNWTGLIRFGYQGNLGSVKWVRKWNPCLLHSFGSLVGKGIPLPLDGKGRVFTICVCCSSQGCKESNMTAQQRCYTEQKRQRKRKNIFFNSFGKPLA